MKDQDQSNNLARFGICIGGLLVLALLALLTWYLTFVTFIDVYEFAFVYDKVSGKVQPIKKTGYVVYTPFLFSVHTIDLRPYQISITPGHDHMSGSTGGDDVGSRVLNAKLVRFNPDGLDKFLEWHGRKAGDDLKRMLTILKAYAFDRTNGHDCPFLTVVTELATTPSSQISENRVMK